MQVVSQNMHGQGQSPGHHFRVWVPRGVHLGLVYIREVQPLESLPAYSLVTRTTVHPWSKFNSS